jgi:two-component system cell cycle response regulator CpdR
MARLRVIVADDDADLLGVVAAALTLGAGADVVCAETGTELLSALADEGPFDLLITDVSMPWMSGLQVVHAAREAGLDVPIIVMTGLREAVVRDSVAALGGSAVLIQKPFTTAKLRMAIDSLLPGTWRPAQIAV